MKERKSHIMLKIFKISCALHEVPTSCLYEQSLATITKQFVDIFLQTTMCQLIKLSTCTFSHMTYLMSHVTCLNNTRR